MLFVLLSWSSFLLCVLSLRRDVLSLKDLLELEDHSEIAQAASNSTVVDSASALVHASSPGPEPLCYVMRADGLNARGLSKCVGKWIGWSVAKPGVHQDRPSILKPEKWTTLDNRALLMGDGANAYGFVVPFGKSAGPACSGLKIAVKIASKSSAEKNVTQLTKFKSPYILQVFDIADAPLHYDDELQKNDQVVFYDEQRNKYDVKVKIVALEAADYDLDKFAQFENPHMVPSAFRRVDPCAPAVIASLARDVLEGLKVLHDRAYAHADVKPSNILLMCSVGGSLPSSWQLGQAPETLGHCRAKLADLETACGVKGIFSCAGKAIGTPKFLSPSLVAGKKRSRSDDLWALGVSLLSLVLQGPDRKAIGENLDRGIFWFDKKEAMFLPILEAKQAMELAPLFEALLQPSDNKAKEGFEPTQRALAIAKTLAVSSEPVNLPSLSAVEKCWKR